MNTARQQVELTQFRDLWEGGYYEGNPLDPMAPSGYGPFGYMSCLHATYLRCIKPYVSENTRVLEIGPGRGAWTRCFLARNAQEIWALDALSAEHNGFWEYVGRRPNVHYCQVQDDLCAMVPDASIDYFFSFGTFCHLSPQVTRDYLKSIFRTMRPGAHGFLMIADYNKFNSLLTSGEQLSISRSLTGKRFLPMRWLWRLWFSLVKPHTFRVHDEAEDDTPRPGRWYHLGVGRAVEMLQAAGFVVIDPDVGVNHRDPVIEFEKPTAA
jgi:hypothetical protein